jgi:hypothetical protein
MSSATTFAASAERATTVTRQPASAKRLAMPRPMPLLAPVTMTLL